MSIGDKIKSWEKVGLAKAISDVLSNIPSSVEVNTTSDAPPEAYRVANQLNSLRDELELVRHVEPGTFTDDEYSLEDGWPDDPDVPEEPEVPEVPDEPDVPELPDEPEVPEVEFL